MGQQTGRHARPVPRCLYGHPVASRRAQLLKRMVPAPVKRVVRRGEDAVKAVAIIILAAVMVGHWAMNVTLIPGVDIPFLPFIDSPCATAPGSSGPTTIPADWHPTPGSDPFRFEPVSQKQAAAVTDQLGHSLNVWWGYFKAAYQASYRGQPSDYQTIATAAFGCAGPSYSGAGWTQAFRDDFTIPGRPAGWAVFNGNNSQTGPRAAGNATVHDGTLDLTVQPVAGRSSAWGGWAGASVGAVRAPTLYGQMQARMWATPGPGFRTVAMGWPQKDSGQTGQHDWPPELDFQEGSSNTVNTATTHWYDPTRPGNNGMIWRKFPADKLVAHTYGVQWTPTTVTYLYDGQPAGTTVKSPSVPLWLGLTAAMLPGGVHPASPQHMYVDWVQVDSYTPGSCDTATPPVYTRTGARGAVSVADSTSTVTPAQARQYAAAAGFTGPDVDIAGAVAQAESSLNPTATNSNSNGSTDYGLWQINSVHSDVLASGDWRDPAANARMAHSVWAGSGWGAWTTYNSGAYRQYLTGGTAAPPACAPTTQPVGYGTGQGAVAVKWALAHLGVPYVFGGNSPTSGMDCSSYTMFAWQAAGVTLPRTANEQYGATARITPGQQQPGDLIFDEYGTRVAGWGHVMLYIGNGQVASEPHTGEVSQVQTMPTSGYAVGRPA